MRRTRDKTGLWLIGAGGNVATAVAVGLAARRRGLIAGTGLLTDGPELADAGLIAWDEMVLGGHDVIAVDPLARARALAGSGGILPAPLVEAVADALASFGREIRPGAAAASAGALAAVAADLDDFRARHDLVRVVVVNLASTEAPWDGPGADDPSAIAAAIADATAPVSVLYAYAALDRGAAYINFTPSTGASLPGLETLARARGAVHAGRDGKTGETLVKAALAPMFAVRRLEVLSWFGQNILGNDDGRTLTGGDALASKARSKGGLLPALLGYQPEAGIGIDFVGALGDWKIAWDHIQFAGFLGTRMSLQFTWQGADSILAAPLVLDLARLADRALAGGERGLLPYLGLFFKEPLGTTEHGLDAQLARLLAHVRREPGPAAPAGVER